MQTTGSRRGGISDAALLLGVPFLWALCYPLIRTGLSFAPPLHFAALRAALAGSALLAACYFQRRRMPKGTRVWVELSGVALCMTSIGFLGMFLAGGTVSPGLATVVSNAQPLFAALIAYFVLRERLRGYLRVALFVGFAGIVVIAGPDLTTQPSQLGGILYVLLGALGVAAGNVLLKRLAQRLDALAAMGWQLLIGSLPLFGAAELLEGSEAIHWEWRFALVVIFLSLLGTALAYVMWFMLLQRFELNRANTYSFLTPVFALLLGAGFYSERLSLLQWAGAALVVLASVLARPGTPRS